MLIPKTKIYLRKQAIKQKITKTNPAKCQKIANIDQLNAHRH